MKKRSFPNSQWTNTFLLLLLFATSVLVLSSNTRAKPNNFKEPETVDMIRCTSLKNSIKNYVNSSLSTMDLCGLALTQEAYVTIVVTYYVDANSEVDLDDVKSQILLGIQNAAELPDGCVSFSNTSAVTCTTGYHNLDVTLKYCRYCVNE